MKTRLISVGERMPAWVADGFAEYRKRLSHDLPFELVEIPLGARGKGRDCARAIVDARSVLVALGIADGGVAAKASSRPFTVSEFARERSLDVDAAVAELLDLELGGFVTRHPDGGYVLV